MDKNLSKVLMGAGIAFLVGGVAGAGLTYRDITTENLMQQVVLEHAVRDSSAPLYSITADSARWDPELRRWSFLNGASHVLSPGGGAMTLTFAELRLPAFREAPPDLLVEPKNHSEMTYGELGRYIASLRASGNDTRKLEVEQAVKLALPTACLIIALFGAPLAMSAPRAGAAVGIAISLGTTLAYLLMINLAQAVGASGIMHPVAAAWAPNALFLIVGVVILAKVRT